MMSFNRRGRPQKNFSISFIKLLEVTKKLINFKDVFKSPIPESLCIKMLTKEHSINGNWNNDNYKF